MNSDIENTYIEEIRDLCIRCDNGREISIGSIVLSSGEHSSWKKGETPRPDYCIIVGVIKSICADSIGIETTVRYNLNPRTCLPITKCEIKQPVEYFPCDCCDIPIEDELRAKREFSQLVDVVF